VRVRQTFVGYATHTVVELGRVSTKTALQSIEDVRVDLSKLIEDAETGL